MVFSTHSCTKLFGDRLLDVDALDGKAGLAAIREAAPDGGARCDVEIGVGENDHRVFAAEFENGRNQFAGAGFGDSASSGDAAGEENFRRAGFDDCGAELAAALQDLYQTLRKAGAIDQFADQRASGGREFRGLQQHGVSGDERGNQFRHRNREGKIPGRNNCDDAMRLEFEPTGFRLQRDVVVRDAFGAQPSRRLAREEVGGVECEKHFGEDGFDARLAGFASDDVRDLVAAFEDCVAKLAKHCAAFC